MGTPKDPRVARIWPKQVQTAGLMRELSASVAAYCPVCRTQFRVDLEAIIQLRGRSYSLIDQRGPCRRYDCKGKAFFIWSPGAGVPFRALTTDAGDMAWINAETAAAKKVAGDTPPDDDPPPPRPPRAPAGIDPAAWQRANESERKRLVRIARG